MSRLRSMLSDWKTWQHGNFSNLGCGRVESVLTGFSTTFLRKLIPTIYSRHRNKLSGCKTRQHRIIWENTKTCGQVFRPDWGEHMRLKKCIKFCAIPAMCPGFGACCQIENRDSTATVTIQECAFENPTAQNQKLMISEILTIKLNLISNIFHTHLC